MFMYSLKDTTITLGAARMWVQCLGFQGPWKAVRSLPCLNFPRETLTVINHFETNDKKECFMKAVSEIILIRFFSSTTWYQLPNLRASTELSPEREKTVLSLLSQTLPLLCSPLLHQGLRSRAPGSAWLPGLLSSSASDCCGSAQRHAGSEGKTKALKRKIRHKGTFSAWGLKQLKTQGTPGFTAATASWRAPTPRLTPSLLYREFNPLGAHE